MKKRFKIIIVFLIMAIVFLNAIVFTFAQKNDNVRNNDGHLVKVTFMVDGLEYRSGYFESGTLVTLPTPPPDTEEGHFVSWYANGESQPYNPQRILENDMVLHAKFGDQHIVTFYDEFGLALDLVEVSYGSTVGERGPDGINFEVGEEFEYWVTEGGNRYDFASAVTDNLMLYPQITNRSIVIFKVYGYDSPPQIVTDGHYAEKPQSNPERPGYIFIDWYAVDECTGANGCIKDDEHPENNSCVEFFDFATTPINGVVFVYAGWKPEKVGYTINFYNEISNFSGTPGKPVGPLPESDKYNPNADINIAYMDQYELVYTHVIDKDDPNFARNAGSFFCHDVVDINFDEIFTSRNDDVINDQLDFSEFYTHNQCYLEGDGSTIINVFYKKIVYKFNFNFDSNTPSYAYIYKSDEPLDQVYSFEAKLGQDTTYLWPYRVVPKDASKRFVNFSGYYGLGALTMTPSYIRIAMNNHSYINPAKGRPTTTNSATLTPKGSSAKMKEQRLYFGEMLEDEWPEGFETFYNDLGNISPGTPYFYGEDPSSEYSDDKDYYAVYKPKSGNDTAIRYYKTIARSTWNYQPSEPSTGTFQNWPGRDYLGFRWIRAANNTQDTTYRTTNFQAWSPLLEQNEGTIQAINLYYFMPRISYSLTLDLQGGTWGETEPGNGFELKDGLYRQDVLYQDIIPTTDVEPVKQGTTFDGWYYDDLFTRPFSPNDRMPAGAITLHAKYVTDPVDIYYYDDKVLVKAYDKGEYRKNDTIKEHDLSGTDYADYKKGDVIDGKGVFLGWYYYPTSSEASDSLILVEIPLGAQLKRDRYDLYAQWGKEIYTVTYAAYLDCSVCNADDGSCDSCPICTDADGCSKHIIDNPCENCSICPDDNVDCTDCKICYENKKCKCILKTYEVQRVRAGFNTISLSGHHLPSSPETMDGYRFIGWNFAPDGSKNWFSARTEVDTDITVYAIWEPIWYITDYQFYKVDKKNNPLSGVVFGLYSCTHTHADESCTHQHDDECNDGCTHTCDETCGGLTPRIECTHTHTLPSSTDDGCWDLENGITAISREKDGRVLFPKVAEGTYILMELQTIEGFQLPHGYWTVDIQFDESWQIDIKAFATEDILPPAFYTEVVLTENGETTVYKLPNYKNFRFPMTGQKGIFYFILAGSLFFLIASVVIVLPSRKKARRVSGKD